MEPMHATRTRKQGWDHPPPGVRYNQKSLLHGNLPNVRYNRKSLFSRSRSDILDLENRAVLDFKMITSDEDLIARYERQIIGYMEDNGVENGVIVWYRMENGVARIVDGPR